MSLSQACLRANEPSPGNGWQESIFIPSEREARGGTSQLQETFLPNENWQIAIARFLQKSQNKLFAAGAVQDDKITRLPLMLSLP
jgi:uncharacterized membrane protein